MVIARDDPSFKSLFAMTNSKSYQRTFHIIAHFNIKVNDCDIVSVM